MAEPRGTRTEAGRPWPTCALCPWNPGFIKRSWTRSLRLRPGRAEGSEVLSSAPSTRTHRADALLSPGPDGELYSGTSYNFLGSEPIISRNSSQSPLRTEYAIPWLNGERRVPHPACPLGSRRARTAPCAASLEPSSSSTSRGPHALITGARALGLLGLPSQLRGLGSHGVHSLPPGAGSGLRGAGSEGRGAQALIGLGWDGNLSPRAARGHVTFVEQIAQATHEAFLVGASQQPGP